ncbi:hypothetical protein KEU06_27100 [Pseudaminobacter sp. 19-2017]|uniref:Uncharacterized protein n=1 Tax=Pseudaminobacter soli (ex Zhang et al. 2022) TaxID=2831468 RepID=A0A942IBF8_9HYPH|nr:hypothetical protein [Pseudaminobacter soli]MBS3652265.1 hypothetical protein [Pseudaminobacter soli]
MRVEEELKRKRAELLGDVEELAIRIETIKEQVSAIDQVIAIYDPAHTTPSPTTAARKRSSQAIPLPIELEQLSKTAAILEVLREAGEPLSSTDCTSRIAVKHGVAPDNPAHPRFATHVSAGLNSLMKGKRVRQVGDCRWPEAPLGDRRVGWHPASWCD